MKKIPLFAVALVASLAMLAGVARAEEPPADDAAKKAALEKLIVRGKELVESKKCSLCHAIDGKGGKTGKPMNGITEGHNDEFLKGSLLDPKKTIKPDVKMPAYKFTDDEVKAVIEYIKSLKKPEPTAKP